MPVMVAEEVQVLPNEVSRVLACNCKAAEPVHVSYLTKCYNEWTVEQASFYDSNPTLKNRSWYKLIDCT